MASPTWKHQITVEYKSTRCENSNITCNSYFTSANTEAGSSVGIHHLCVSEIVTVRHCTECWVECWFLKNGRKHQPQLGAISDSTWQGPKKTATPSRVTATHPGLERHTFRIYNSVTQFLQTVHKSVVFHCLLRCLFGLYEHQSTPTRLLFIEGISWF